MLRVEVARVSDKRLITAVFCSLLTGAFLPVQVIYQGKTNRCHPHYQFPPDWDITHSPTHWSKEETMIQYVENIIIPYVAAVRAAFEEDVPALVWRKCHSCGSSTAKHHRFISAHGSISKQARKGFLKEAI